MNRILSFFFVACLAIMSLGAFAQTTYVKVTEVSQLVDGGKYLIVYEGGNVAFDGSLATLDAVSNTKPVTISDGTISATDNDFYFTLDEIEGGYSVKSASGYYIGDTANDNKIVSSQTETFLNTIEFSASAAEIICSRNHLRYNANDGQNRFRYYKESSYTNQQAIALYIDASNLGTDPMISIITPANGSTINNSTVTATVQVIHFVAGTDGNISFAIDSEDAIVGTATSHTFEGLAEGQHTITASLVGTDETVVATATSTFTVNLSGPSTTSIHDIQYTEAEDGASPYNEQTVTVSGTVTAFNSDKFYIQDAEAAWSGLYIYNTNPDRKPNLSDNVTVTGKIIEYNGLTEMSDVTEVINNGAATPINGLVLQSISEIGEAYESVLVTITGTCTNVGGAKKWTIDDGTSIVIFGLAYSPTLGTSYTVTGVVDWYGQDSIWEVKPRSENDIVVGDAGDITYTPIRDIQYTTEESGDSPLNNQTVWVKGVVTSNFTSTPYFPVKGYSIQDANEAWSGVWVFDSINNPSIGDSVKFQATVTEYYGLTELKNVANYEVFDIGIATPIDVTVNEAKSEAYEGCYVRVECARSTGHTMPYGNWTCVNAAGDTITFSHNFANDAYTIQDNKYYSVAGVVEYSYGKYYVNYPTVNDIIADCDASVDEMLASSIEVYPNPTTGMLNIANAEGKSIVVINALGQVVAHIDNAAENQTIDLSRLCDGTYFVKVDGNVVKISMIR